MEETISLQEIMKILRKRLFLIISLVIISVGIAAIISYFVLTPIYQAQTQIIVNQQKGGNQEGYAWTDQQSDLQLISTYNVIITSSAILSKVIEELDLDISPEILASQIVVSNENDSHVVNLIVKDEDPAQAVKISNVIAETFKEDIPGLMSVDNIKILSVAKLSENPTPVEPNQKLNMAIAAVIGLMIGIGLAFLFEFLDTTVKTERDIEELELPIMGLVSSIAIEKESYTNELRRRRG